VATIYDVLELLLEEMGAGMWMLHMPASAFPLLLR
jgi:hypothetical protein